LNLKSQITEAMKTAMRGRDAPRLSAIRLLLAAIKQREVDERKDLSDAEIVSVIEKLIKQRRDAIAQFEAAGRHDLAAAEKFELEVLASYMPQPLAEAEIVSAIDHAIQATGAVGPKDMGKVMAQLKQELTGRAEMSRVSALVKAKLSS
jgi:uncharacterized protein YqeY